jgi:hypothetical protein
MRFVFRSLSVKCYVYKCNLCQLPLSHASSFARTLDLGCLINAKTVRFCLQVYAAPRASLPLARDFGLEARQSQQPEVACDGWRRQQRQRVMRRHLHSSSAGNLLVNAVAE